MSWPGMQKPHWTPPWSRKACWRRRQRALGREALDRDDLAAVGLDRQHQAGVDDAPVEPHRAGAALPDQAALLRARQVEVVAEDLEERVMGRDLQPTWPAVDG